MRTASSFDRVDYCGAGSFSCWRSSNILRPRSSSSSERVPPAELEIVPEPPPEAAERDGDITDRIARLISPGDDDRNGLGDDGVGWNLIGNPMAHLDHVVSPIAIDVRDKLPEQKLGPSVVVPERTGGPLEFIRAVALGDRHSCLDPHVGTGRLRISDAGEVLIANRNSTN